MSIEKLSKVVKILQEEGSASPNKIATKVGSDRRTIQKIMKVASNLGLVKCETFKVGERTYARCSLTPEYLKVARSAKKGRR